MPQVASELLNAAHMLGQTLKQTWQVKAYTDAVAALDRDQQALGLLKELKDAQAALRVNQSNQVTSEQITRLREFQHLVRIHPTIATYLAAQQDVQTYLSEINHAIGNQLGIDFAALGKSSSCC